MKKFVSIALSLFIFACSANMLAAGENGNNVEQKKQLQQKSEFKGQGQEISTCNKFHSFLLKLGEVRGVRSAWSLFYIVGVFVGLPYLTYKVCDKTGLIGDIKNVVLRLVKTKSIDSTIECIGKTKALKNLLVFGSIYGSMCAIAFGYITSGKKKYMTPISEEPKPGVLDYISAIIFGPLVVPPFLLFTLADPWDNKFGLLNGYAVGMSHSRQK